MGREMASIVFNHITHAPRPAEFDSVKRVKQVVESYRPRGGFRFKRAQKLSTARRLVESAIDAHIPQASLLVVETPQYVAFQARILDRQVIGSYLYRLADSYDIPGLGFTGRWYGNLLVIDVDGGKRRRWEKV